MSSFNCFICANEYKSEDLNFFQFKKTGNKYHVCKVCLTKSEDINIEIKTIIASFSENKNVL